MVADGAGRLTDSAPVPGKVAGVARRGRRRGELTVATIAQLAGVSAPTVSKVLNGRSGVAAATRRRVETVLREHGYRRPDAVLPGAGVEVVFHRMEAHLAIEIMRGVEAVVRHHDLSVAFTDVQSRTPTERSWAEQLLARRPFGVIAVHSAANARQHALLAAGGIPLVVVDPTGEPSHATPSVGATNWSGAIEATRHLLALGHRRIATISGPAAYLCSRARLEGCRAALETAGVPLDDTLVRIGRFCFEDGRELGRDLLSLPDPPTAIQCGDDLQALGVYEAAREAGIRIPQDLSVVGFDDMETTRWCGPPMTTVRQPFDEMGSAAADLVLTLAAGRTPAQSRIVLATTLLVRGSTAPPPPR